VPGQNDQRVPPRSPSGEPRVDAVTLLVGPEGGLSNGERRQCEEKGLKAISLGPRTLRTETAALAGIAVLQAYWGDLD